MRCGHSKNVMEFVDPDMVFFIYYEDEPAAFCVIFPDISPLLKRLNGRIGLMGVLSSSCIGGRSTDCGC